jgi:hypothetical protein
MLIIGIVLAFVALAYLCWLLFALAVYALPLFAGLSAGLAAYHSGSGRIGAIIVGVSIGAVTLLLGQVAFAKVRSPLIRTGVALFFAAPASLAGSCFLSVISARSRKRLDGTSPQPTRDDRPTRLPGARPAVSADLHACISFSSPGDACLLCVSLDIRQFSAILLRIQPGAQIVVNPDGEELSFLCS